MFGRVNGSGRQSVTPFLYVCFEWENEEPERSILTMNVVFCAELEEARSVLKNRCSTLAIKFKMCKS